MAVRQLPGSKSTYEHMGRMVPGTDVEPRASLAAWGVALSIYRKEVHAIFF